MPRSALLLVLAATLRLAAADAACGDWLTGDGKARVRIAPSADGKTDVGTIVWLREPNGDDGLPRRDVNTPEAERRGRPVLGLAIVTGLEHDDGKTWTGGRIYDPVSGKTYRCKATLAKDGKTLKLRGYIGISLLGRTDVWTRVPPAADQAAPATPEATPPAPTK